jgi:hypothetical protein
MKYYSSLMIVAFLLGFGFAKGVDYLHDIWVISENKK